MPSTRRRRTPAWRRCLVSSTPASLQARALRIDGPPLPTRRDATSRVTARRSRSAHSPPTEGMQAPTSEWRAPDPAFGRWRGGADRRPPVWRHPEFGAACSATLFWAVVGTGGRPARSPKLSSRSRTTLGSWRRGIRRCSAWFPAGRRSDQCRHATAAPRSPGSSIRWRTPRRVPPLRRSAVVGQPGTKARRATVDYIRRLRLRKMP